MNFGLIDEYYNWLLFVNWLRYKKEVLYEVQMWQKIKMQILCFLWWNQVLRGVYVVFVFFCY